MKQVITIPNELLRQKCEKVTEITPEIKSFAKELTEFLEAHKDDSPSPISISAPQLGGNIRMFAFRNNPLVYNEGDIQVVMNPEMVYAKGFHLTRESCLSIPGKTFTLQRHKLVKIRGLMLDGSIRSFRGRDILAQVFEHELNHLDGILLDVVGR